MHQMTKEGSEAGIRKTPFSCSCASLPSISPRIFFFYFFFFFISFPPRRQGPNGEPDKEAVCVTSAFLFTPSVFSSLPPTSSPHLLPLSLRRPSRPCPPLSSHPA